MAVIDAFTLSATAGAFGIFLLNYWFESQHRLVGLDTSTEDYEFFYFIVSKSLSFGVYFFSFLVIAALFGR